MDNNFNSLSDKRTVAEIIKERNRRENERTDKLIKETKEFLEKIKSKRDFTTSFVSSLIEQTRP